MTILIFLSSGLFLGWSLGANDAANVFGTAVGSKMVRFKTAAIVAGIFIILGAGVSGAGAASTIGKLGSVNEIAGSFVVALAAALTVYWMTKLKLPVSTSQSIVGAIIGWNFFSGSLTDYESLIKIVLTWVICPFLAAFFSIVFYKFLKFLLGKLKIHLLKLDFYNRLGLIIVGAFGSYSLGANNIANVMGVFTTVSPLKPLDLSFFTLSGNEQLFLLGGIAIAIGVFTYSHKVMATVGSDLVKLNPESAFIVVLSSGIVMFLFASQGLENWLALNNLPTIPLVPVSSSQAVVGAILGIGLIQGGRGVNYRVLGGIASGWITAPIIAGILSFVSLFFLQNVFNQNVYRPVLHVISNEVIKKIELEGINDSCINPMRNKKYKDAMSFKNDIDKFCFGINDNQKINIIGYAKEDSLKVTIRVIHKEIKSGWFSAEQIEALRKLENNIYSHSWQLYDDLAGLSEKWKFKPNIPQNRISNKLLEDKLNYLYRIFNFNKDYQ